MKRLDFHKLMAKKPTELTTETNRLGQRVTFVEHPTRGEESPVIAVFKDAGLAFETDFFDCGDFFPESDYMPILSQDGIPSCSYQFETQR